MIALAVVTVPVVLVVGAHCCVPLVIVPLTVQAAPESIQGDCVDVVKVTLKLLPNWVLAKIMLEVGVELSEVV